MQPWVIPFLLDPDPHKYVEQLPLSSPMAMQNLYDISFEDILDVLEELGDNLDFDKNPYFHAGNGGLVSVATPQDAIEPLRRMCKWIMEETCIPDKVFPLWRSAEDSARQSPAE